jgi:glycosyltransferase involved in cell wall biosynthesis
MRILCITSSYPRDEQDISGIFVRRWREELEAFGANVTVLTWRAPDTGAARDARGEQGVHRVPYAPRAREVLFYGAGAPENIATNPLLLGLAPVAIGAMLVEGARWLMRERFDWVVGHWLLPGGWIARVLGKMFDVPSLVVTHSGGIDMLSKLPTRINKGLARFLAAGPMTFVSNEAKSRFIASGVIPGASRILPMGFDAFEPAEGEDGSLERTILSLGRLVPIKGIDDLIRAVARVDLPDVSLHIAGDGPERERLEALSLGLGVRATFHGVVRGAQKRRLLEQSALSIFASRAEEGRHEGLPVSFLECASACAYPLVAELPGALPLLHDPDRQRLDPDRDLDRWAARIKEELASSGRARHEFMARSLAQRELVIPLSWERLGIKWAEALSQPSTFSRR